MVSGVCLGEEVVGYEGGHVLDALLLLLLTALSPAPATYPPNHPLGYKMKIRIGRKLLGCTADPHPFYGDTEWHLLRCRPDPFRISLFI